MNVTQEIDDFNLNWDSYSEPWRAIEFARKLGDKLEEVQAKYDILAIENMMEVNKICKQRDEAIKELKEAWLAMDEIEGTDRINEWQNKNAYLLEEA